MPDDVITSEIAEIKPRTNTIRHFFKIFFSRGLVIFGAVVIVIFFILAIFGPVIAPYNPTEQDLDNVMVQPSAEHWIGTDNLGRDTLSRLIYGARNSLMIGVVALAIAAIIGMGAGLLAGYFGGWVDHIIMRFIDALMAFPMILLALMIAALLGGGLTNVMVAIGISLIPGYARLMYSLVISTRESDYIMAERSLGAGNVHIMIKHIFPNCIPPLIVLITMQIGNAILAEAGLSFLGVGITPPAPAWGAMVNGGYKYLATYPLLSFAPGLAIMLVVFAFNMVGDGLRDALDPRLRGLL